MTAVVPTGRQEMFPLSQTFCSIQVSNLLGEEYPH